MKARSYNESFSDFLLHLHPRTIPASSARVGFTWCLGGLAFWMLLIEAVTGALLMLYYVPTTGAAYYSIQRVTHVVPYGFIVRNLHYWCGQIMVILVGLHMVRVFVTGSFASPRRLNWIIGAALLAGTILVDFTGYLIVWDDRSLWAWTVARNLAAKMPVVGASIASLLFGSVPVTDEVLVRLYAWHVIMLPALLGVFTAWHFWQIRKNGGISTPL